MEKFYTLKELEVLLKVGNRTLLTYLKTGKLKGTKVGKRWIVTEEAVNKLIRGE